jgi:hypothetical protein
MKKIILFFIVSLVTITAGTALAATNEAAPTCANGQVNCMPIIYLIKNDITLNVPGDSPFGFAEHKYLRTIQDALKELTDKKIAPSAVVTIKLTQNPPDKYSTIVVDHPDGDKIHIIGDCDGNSCNLLFEEKTNGLQVSDGNKLGLIDGFYFIGTADSQDNQFYGIYANDSGVIKTGENMAVQNFYNGIFADNHSYILANKIKSTNNAHDGILASNGSTITANNAVTNDNKYCGVHAENSSNIYGDDIQSKNNSMGVFAAFASSITIRGSLVAGNSDGGILADYNAIISASGSDASENSHSSYQATYNAGVACIRCIAGKVVTTTGGYVCGEFDPKVPSL